MDTLRTLSSLSLNTHMVMQESVILSKHYILGNMTIWPQMSYYQGLKSK